MFQRYFTKLGGFSIYILAFAVGALGTYLWLHSNFFAPYDRGQTATKTFEIEKGWNIKKISRKLEENGLIKNWWSVYYLSRIKAQAGGEKNFKILSGEYALSPSQTPAEILSKVLNGEVIYYEVTIPEGTTDAELPQLLTKTGIVSLEDVVSVLNDKQLLSSLNIPAPTLEGYLFPETYRFTRADTALTMINQMAQEGAKRRTKEMYERAIELGFTFHQILTLASIIEKETGAAEERPKISSVFHNRLKLNMPLQSDPTVIYGIENFNGNLTKDDLAQPGPYNTYVNVGLPPTPICNPGSDAILAALYPEETEFLYFVAKGDGTHAFSASYEQHRKAVDQYQRGKQAAQNVEPKSEDQQRKDWLKTYQEPGAKAGEDTSVNIDND